MDAHRNRPLSVLSFELEQLRRPRGSHGARAALRILLTAREHITIERTATVNALTALLRVTTLGFDARKPLISMQIVQVSRWRTRVEDLGTATARGEAVGLAKRVVDLTEDLTTNQVQMTGLIRDSKAALRMDRTGIGPVTAAVVYTAWSHRRTPGECVLKQPAPPSRESIRFPRRQGNTTRHRLSRGGGRRLNRAQHMAVVTRVTHDPETRSYVDRRRAEGCTSKEIR